MDNDVLPRRIGTVSWPALSRVKGSNLISSCQGVLWTQGPSVNTAPLFLYLVTMPQTLGNLSGICPVQALPNDVGGSQSLI